MSSPHLAAPGQHFTLQVERIAAGGQGIALLEGIPVFIPRGIPGQRLEVAITKVKDRYMEAKVLKVLGTAPGEVQPRCKHFASCGGCVWQHLPYEKQIVAKEDIVRETLEHLTPVDEKIRKNLPGRVMSIIPSPQVYYYRNKLELSFGFTGASKEESVIPTNGPPKKFDVVVTSGNGSGTSTRIPLEGQPSIGFHQPNEWATILPITECHLYDERIPTLLEDVRRFMEQTHLPVYNPRNHKGVLRTLLLRRGIHTEEQMICFIVQARKRELEPLFQHFMRFGQRPEVKSLLIVEHFGLNDKPETPVPASAAPIIMPRSKTSVMHVLKGDPFIRERLIDLTFELSPFSFFQTNTLAAEKMYQVIAKFADLSGRETVLDCYCGIGSIGQFLSRFAQKVVGVESNASAVEDALRSAGKNKIGNISFYKGLAEDVLSKQLAPGGKYAFDVIVLDPPRAGLHKKVITAALGHKPRRIVYVSCNVATFARDLAEFLNGGYDLRLVQPIDLFPHTAHVETVALLERS